MDGYGLGKVLALCKIRQVCARKRMLNIFPISFPVVAIGADI